MIKYMARGKTVFLLFRESMTRSVRLVSVCDVITCSPKRVGATSWTDIAFLNVCTCDLNDAVQSWWLTNNLKAAVIATGWSKSQTLTDSKLLRRSSLIWSRTAPSLVLYRVKALTNYDDFFPTTVRIATSYVYNQNRKKWCNTYFSWSNKSL